jgi:hypothetical protein
MGIGIIYKVEGKGEETQTRMYSLLVGLELDGNINMALWFWWLRWVVS